MLDPMLDTVPSQAMLHTHAMLVPVLDVDTVPSHATETRLASLP